MQTDGRRVRKHRPDVVGNRLDRDDGKGRGLDRLRQNCHRLGPRCGEGRSLGTWSLVAGFEVTAGLAVRRVNRLLGSGRLYLGARISRAELADRTVDTHVRRVTGVNPPQDKGDDKNERV